MIIYLPIQHLPVEIVLMVQKHYFEELKKNFIFKCTIERKIMLMDKYSLWDLEVPHYILLTWEELTGLQKVTVEWSGSGKRIVFK